jgi:hypothetical protein
VLATPLQDDSKGELRVDWYFANIKYFLEQLTDLAPQLMMTVTSLYGAYEYIRWKMTRRSPTTDANSNVSRRIGWVIAEDGHCAVLYGTDTSAAVLSLGVTRAPRPNTSVDPSSAALSVAQTHPAICM